MTTGGTFRFQDRLLDLATAMVDQQTGLEETDDGIWAIHFDMGLLATFDERDHRLTGNSQSVTHVAGLYCYLSPRYPERGG